MPRWGNVHDASLPGCRRILGSGARAAGSVPAGEALGREAELVALGVLHHGPAVSRDLVLAGDCGAKPDQLIDGCGGWIHQVEVNAVFGPLDLGHLVEVPGRLLPPGVGPADRSKPFAAALIEWAAQHRRPEGRQL